MTEKIYKTITDLKENDVFKHFIKITEIPHNSFEEKELSDSIKAWAEGMKFEVKQDDYNNLLIRKKGSKGREDEKPVILQAHLDMVCEKIPTYDHDFSKDPIPLVLEKDILSTGGKTTLGADDGIGVALAMAVLENAADHPPIDAIFTTAEEEDLSGAINVNKSWFSTNRIINIDNTFDNQIVMGSAGGKGVEILFNKEEEEIEGEKVFYQVDLCGLMGGHSGEDIDKGRGNAIIILANLLDHLKKDIDYRVTKIDGGNFRLAIPREAKATLAIDKKDKVIFLKKVSEFKGFMDEIFHTSAKDFDMLVAEDEKCEWALSQATLDKIIELVLLFPNGINDMMPGLTIVESSCNLGEIHMGEEIKLAAEIRATYEINTDLIYRKIKILGEKLGARVRDFAAYPSWKFMADSELAKSYRKTHESLYGEDMEVIVIHAGLEPGCFAPKIEDMDAISIGPNVWSLHSPSERISISSTDKTYRILTNLLKNI